MSDYSELQRLWLLVQSERNPDEQAKHLCDSMFPIFSKLCTSSVSTAYKSTFGDGRALASVVCRIYSHFADPSKGIHGINAIMSSQRYAVLLSYLSTLLEPEYYRAANADNESRIVATLAEIRVDVMRHDILKIMLSLHNIFLEVISGQTGNLSDSSVAAEQTHLAIFKCLLETGDARVLSEAASLRCFQSIASTLTICFMNPFRGSSSLTRMAADAIDTVLSHEGTALVVAPESVLLSEEDTLYARLAEDVRRSDEIFDIAIKTQKLCTLAHCVHTLRLLRATSRTRSQVRADMLITSFLSLQNVMSFQKSLVEQMFEDYIHFSFISVTVSAPKKKEKSSGVLGFAKKKLVSMVFVKEDVQVDEIRFAPDCLRKAMDFITRATFSEPRLWFAARLCDCLLRVGRIDGPDVHTTSSIMFDLCQHATSYDSDLLRRVLSTLSGIAELEVGVDVSSSLTSLATALISMDSAKQEIVVRFFTTLASANNRKLLTAVGESSIVVATCAVVDKFSMSLSSLDEGAMEVADSIFCLWKILLLTDEFIRDFSNGMSLPNLIKCTLAPAHSPLNVKFVVSSRNALVSLVQQRKENVSALLDAILSREKREWTAETTQHIVNLAVTIYGAHCHEEVIAHNGITIVLSLLQYVRNSQHFAFNLHVLSFILFMLLSHVRWSDAPAMLVSSIPNTLINLPEAVRFVLVIACGKGVQSQILANMLDACYGDMEDPSIEAVKFIEDSTPQTKLCEVPQLISMLAEWYTISPTELVKEAIWALVDANRTPIADPSFCRLVLDNQWADLMPFLGSYAPLLSMPSGTVADTADVITRWYHATRKVPSRHALTFLGKGNGGAAGRLQMPIPSWPPINGFSISGWFLCSSDSERNASFNMGGSASAHSSSIPLWRLRWDYGADSDNALYLVLDTANKALLLTREMHRVESITAPADIGDQWTHICVVLHRWQNDVTIYLNGNVATKQALDYPVIIKEGGVLATNRLDVGFAFPPANAKKQPMYQQSISMLGVQIYEGPLMPDHVQNLVSAPFHIRDPTIVGFSGATNLSLTAPILANPHLRRIGTSDINTLVRQAASGGNANLRVRIPEVPVVVVLHPSVTKKNAGKWENLGSKQYVLQNMAAMPCVVRLYGRHSDPPTEAGSPIGYFLAHCGPTRWLEWLAMADQLPLEQVSMVLDIVGDSIMEGLEIAELMEREHYFRLASLITSKAKYFTQSALLSSLLRLAIRTFNRHSVIVNGPLTEMLFFNWAFLSGLQYDAVIAILSELGHSINANNPYARLNAWRLRKLGFMDGFICGLTRYYVPPQVLGEAKNVIDRFVHALIWDQSVISDVVTFVAATVPRSKDISAHLAKLASPLPPSCMAHIDATRNIVLSCLLKGITMTSQASHDLSGAIPPSWFPMVTGEYSHPISATLAMSIFSVLYSTSSTFRSRCAKQRTLHCLQSTLAYHAQQYDLYGILMELILGSVRDVFRYSKPADVTIPKGHGANPQVVPLLMELTKQCGLTLRPSATFVSNISTFYYFQMYRERPLPRFRVAATCVRTLVRLRMIATAANYSPLSDAARTPVSNSLSEERAQRADVAASVLDFLARLVISSEAIAKVYFNKEGTIAPLEAISWSLLASTEVADIKGPADTHHKLKRIDSDDSDFDVLENLSTFEAMDMVAKDTAKYPSLLNASLGLYLALLRVHMSQFDIYSIGTPSVRTSDLVYWLHIILCSHPPGIGDRSRGWLHIKILDAWLTRSGELLRSQADDASGTANKVKNAHYLALYIVERLTSGFAVPPKSVASFLVFLSNFTSNSEIVKSVRSAMVDFVLFVLSEQFHGWNPDKVEVSLATFYEYKEYIFKSPFPTTDITKLVTRRLLELTLSTNRKRSDEDPAVMTNEEKAIVELWQLLMTVNKGSPALSQILIDGGPGTGKFRTDLLFNGFDRAQNIVYETDKTAFMLWMYENDERIRELVNTNPNSAADQKYATAIPKRAQQWAQRAEEDVNSDRLHQRTKISEAEKDVESLWSRHGFMGSSVDLSLLDVAAGSRYSLRPFVVQMPIPGDTESPVYLNLGGVASSAPSSEGHQHLLQNGGMPLGAIMTHAGDSCIPLSHADQLGDSQATLLRPTALRISEKILEGNCTENRGAPILWIGNVYHVVGNESLICIMLLTSYEIVIISSAQVTADGNIYLASLETHEANKASQRKAAMVRNVIRRFIPKAPIPTSLDTASLATFRHSQYFRQLRTEAKAIQRDSRVWRFPLATLSSAHHRHFQHEASAVEFVLEDATRLFVVFLDNDLVMSRDARQTVMDHITEQAPHAMVDTNTAKRARVVTAQRKWMRRQISNYEYLLVVNDAASRTFADLTQYPVMPWVLACYNEMFIDLDHAKYFRDLGRPLGALDPTRRKEVMARYTEWLDDTTPPFHYGTHYSTSAIVMYFLIRLQPLTAYAAAYQGGKLDVADRLFHSIEEAWTSCSSATGRDVKELIPEFFSLHQFLTNRNRIELGTRRDGVSLNDVQLPYWATSTAAFIQTNREALESDTVSTSIHSWLDLIFGVKQDGEEAVTACNVFHHLTYAKGFEEAMTSAAAEEDRKAIVASVDNFGLTPKNVFKAPHPRRIVFHPYRSQQDFYLQNITQLQLRTTSGQMCDVHCTGQPITHLAELDGTPLLSTFNRRTTSVKPLQHYIIDVTRYLIINYRTKDQCATVLPDISTFGLGTITTFDCSSTGNVVYVGTSNGSVVVFSRLSWTSRHTIAHILHMGTQLPISTLTSFGDGRLATASGSLLSLWQISRRGVTHQWACRVDRVAMSDDSNVKAVALTHDAVDAVIAVKDRSIYVIVSGEIVTSIHIEKSAPGNSIFTSVAFMAFSSYAPTGVFCCGHSDGRISFWSLTSNYRPRGAAGEKSDNYIVAHVTSRQVDVQGDASAVTCLMPQPQNFSIIVGCKSGALWSVYMPQVSVDAFSGDV